jgi:hypothetical protein
MNVSDAGICLNRSTLQLTSSTANRGTAADKEYLMANPRLLPGHDKYSDNGGLYPGKQVNFDVRAAYEREVDKNKHYVSADERTRGWVNRLADYYFRNSPEEVKQAFYDTIIKTGTNPFPNGIGNTIAELTVEQDFATGGDDDLFGGTLESAIAAIEKILERIANPLPVPEFDLEAYLKSDAFLEMLEHVPPHRRADVKTEYEKQMKAQIKWEASQREEMLKREKEFYQTFLSALNK